MSGWPIKTYVPAPDPVTVEQLAAADLVLAARRAATISKDMPIEEREQYAKRCESLIEELRVACIVFRAGRLEPDHIPIYLRAAKDALTHE